MKSIKLATIKTINGYGFKTKKYAYLVEFKNDTGQLQHNITCVTYSVIPTCDIENREVLRTFGETSIIKITDSQRVGTFIALSNIIEKFFKKHEITSEEDLIKYFNS